MNAHAPTEKQPDLYQIRNFLAELAKALLEYGCSSHRLETLCLRLGNNFSAEVEALAIPTGVWIKVKRGDQQDVDLIRVKQWSVNLDKLSRINQLIFAIEKQGLSLAEARVQLRAAILDKQPYPQWLILVCGALSSGSYIYLNGGNFIECLLAMLGGVIVQIIIRFGQLSDTRRFILEFLGAALVSLFVILISYLPWLGADPFRVLTGGLIILFPGLTFVNAIHEIAQKSLVSGAARLLEALMVAVALGFGVALVFSLKLVLEGF